MSSCVTHALSVKLGLISGWLICCIINYTYDTRYLICFRWLLGYPVVYMFSKQHIANAVYKLSTEYLHIFKISVCRYVFFSGCLNYSLDWYSFHDLLYCPYNHSISSLILWYIAVAGTLPSVGDLRWKNCWGNSQFVIYRQFVWYLSVVESQTFSEIITVQKTLKPISCRCKILVDSHLLCFKWLNSFTVPYDLSMGGSSEKWAKAYMACMQVKWERCRQAWRALHLEVSECYPQAIVL